MEPSTRTESVNSSRTSSANDDAEVDAQNQPAEALPSPAAVSSDDAINESQTQQNNSTQETDSPSAIAREAVAPAAVALEAAEVEAAAPKAAAVDERDPETLWMRWSDQLIVGTIILIALVLATSHYIRLSGFGRYEVEISRQPAREYDLQIEINSATWVEFAQLKGIGPKLARRIVDDREKNGPFHSIDELQRVNGIGPKRVKSMRPFVIVSSDGH